MATKPNTERGLLIGPDLDSDNTVRAMVAELDLVANRFSRSIDVDNSDSPTALALSPLGDYLFVTLQGNDEVTVLDTLLMDVAAGLGSFVTRLGTGAAPRGVAVDPATGRTFVHDFMSRSLTVLETEALFERGDRTVSASTVETVANEPLPLQVAHGKRLFYHAADTRISAEGYLSCATCHVDGGHDGRVFDFAGRGEGLRNTADLRGRGGVGQGNVHWSANFDEIQDFEIDVRNAFGGSGLMDDDDYAQTAAPLGTPKAGLSADLDALAAYVASLGADHLPRSPFRNADGSMTAAAGAGRQMFRTEGCAGCHAGLRFTDSGVGANPPLHDVGTLRTTSGGRLGGPLTGIDTPTLLGAWDTAPYFHDGSAATLDEVFAVGGGIVIPAESGTPSNGGAAREPVRRPQQRRHRARPGLRSLRSTPARLTFTGVDGGPGGTGAIEVRVSDARAIALTVTVNGIVHNVALPNAGNDPTWRHTNWLAVRVENVALTPGASNTIVIGTPDAFPDISIDEIVVTTASHLTRAVPHRRVLALSAGDRANLVAYLRQLDGTPEYNPDPGAGDLFADSFEYGVAAWSAAAP